ncbi:MAG: Panacea domain-containing protein [Nitrospinae bacterium]|nr:Panacea domain-containing protein [Nitrospinota bacterium]
MFNDRKVAQMAAYFVQCEDGRIALLKLMKLLYLAERESLKRYGMPMTGDRMVSMDYGPVLSNTLNLANGAAIASVEGGWDSWISPKQGYDILLARKVCDEDFDELSKADRDILEYVWAKFGDLDEWKISDFTHTLPEWKDPQGTSLPIAYKDVFLALGYEEEQACELSREIEKDKDIDRILQSL